LELTWPACGSPPGNRIAHRAPEHDVWVGQGAESHGKSGETHVSRVYLAGCKNTKIQRDGKNLARLTDCLAGRQHRGPIMAIFYNFAPSAKGQRNQNEVAHK